MANVVVQVPTAHIDTTGVGLVMYAERYLRSAKAVASTPVPKNLGFDPVPYFLHCMSLELHLKAFLWLRDRSMTRCRLRRRYGHRPQALWDDAKAREIQQFARPIPLRDAVVALVGSYYTRRQLNYYDLRMLFSGFDDLKNEPRIVPTLEGLNVRLCKSLRAAVLAAA